MTGRATVASHNGHALVALDRRLQRRCLLRRGIWVAGTAIAVALVAALACRALFADQAQEGLGFGFDPPPGGVRTAWETLSVNLEVASLCFFGAFSASHVGPAEWRRARSRRVAALYCGLVIFYDLAIGLIYLANVVLVGISLGAYGGRMVRALLPHGPVELSAFSLAVAVYLVARQRGIGLVPALRAGMAVVGLLVVAAALETWGAG